jgi:hypothetical protein
MVLDSVFLVTLAWFMFRSSEMSCCSVKGSAARNYFQRTQWAQIPGTIKTFELTTVITFAPSRLFQIISPSDVQASSAYRELSALKHMFNRCGTSFLI